MQPITRRHAMEMGGLGIASTAVGGFGLRARLGAQSNFTPTKDTVFIEPAALRSTRGELRVSLQAAEGPVRIAGRAATALSYNGGLPGPTLHLQPGDRLRVRLMNRLQSATNLHVHGLHVSPEGHSDNVLVAVKPGALFDYDYQLPGNHPPGVFWYHPHHHGTVADQVFGGLYGAIIIGDPQPDLHPVPSNLERVLVISDISLAADSSVRTASSMDRMRGREGDLILVNGQVRPVIITRPGSRERWRVVNACTSRYLRLRLDGQRLQLLGIDSGRLAQPRDIDQIVLAPGNRADLIVTTTSGTAMLRALGYDRGAPSMGGVVSRSSNTARTVLATLQVSGDAVPVLPPIARQAVPRDLRDTPSAGRRQLTFTMGMGAGMGGGMDGGGMDFTIDGRVFDPSRIDQVVPGGAVEEWTIANTSSMDHPFHLHVWPMQLVEVGGQPVTAVIWQDVINVPAHSHITVRIAFETFTGRAVYHCHILDHEDKGMMGIVHVR